MGTHATPTPPAAPVSPPHHGYGPCVRCGSPAGATAYIVYRHPLGTGPLGIASYCPPCWDMVGGAAS